MTTRIEQRVQELLSEDPEDRYQRLLRRGAELVVRHEIRHERARKRRLTRSAPGLSQRDAASRRALAERIAYHELRDEGKPSWKDELDAETRRRVEERADEILRGGRA